MSRTANPRARPIARGAAAVLIAGLVAGLALGRPATAQRWTSLGPAPISQPEYAGRAAALALSAKRRNLYFVGAASGGVWRSRNGGNGWKPLTDELPSLAIGALALDPADERVIYAGSGEPNFAYHSLYGLGLYKSTDGGRSWRVLAAETFAGRAFSRLAVAADGTVWAAVTRAGGSFAGFEGAREHPARKGPTGIFRSTDGGETFAQVRSGLPRVAASDVDLAPGGRIFASFGDVFGRGRNGIYRSVDGGLHFRRLKIGLQGRRIGRISLAVSPADPNRIYALVAGPATKSTSGGFAPDGADTVGLLRSDDGGDTWELSRPGDVQPSYGHYYSAIAAHPTDPDIVVVGGLVLVASFDGGRRFQELPILHVDIHDLAFDAAGRLVVANDGGVERTDELRRGTISRNRKLATVQFYPGMSVDPTDSQAILAGAQDNGTNLRTNAAGDWRLVFGGDGGWTLIHPSNPAILYVQFQGVGNLFRSDDGGESFVQGNVGIPPSDRTAFQAPVLFHPNEPSRMFYATQRLYESVDGGLRWSPISAALTDAPWAVRSLAIAPSDPSVFYAVTSDDRLLVSADGGHTFREARTGVAGWPRIMRQIAVDPLDARRAYVADMRFGGDKILATTDGGATWSSIAGNLPDVPVSTVAVHRVGDERLLFAGTDQGVFSSRDGGGDWKPYATRLPNAPVMDLLVDAPRGRLLASTLGRGLWSAPLPQTVATPQ
jgi:photosystem II stability/assembly factor-like uncharacterized protein